MDPLRNYEVTKLQIAERHQEAARARMAAAARPIAGVDKQETQVRRRWTVRRLVARITLARAGS